MSRYFFHVFDGRVAIDSVGLEFDDEEQVRQEALRGAREMMADPDMGLWLGNAWVMTVADEDANVLFHLRFSIEYIARRLPLIDREMKNE